MAAFLHSELMAERDAAQRRCVELETALYALWLSADLAAEEVAPSHRKEWLDRDIASAKRLLDKVRAERQESINANFRATLRGENRA